MNRLVIIGNGFDLAHGLKTSYEEFITWYVLQCRDKIVQTSLNVKDDLLEIKLQFSVYDTYGNSWLRFIDQCKECKTPKEFFSVIRNWPGSVTMRKEQILDRMLQNIENKGWTDIESDYYELLKENSNSVENCRRLNRQLDFLKEKLAEYLKMQQSGDSLIESITSVLNDGVDENDIEQSSRAKVAGQEYAKTYSVKGHDGMVTYYGVSKTMFLNFNYTATVEKYKTTSSEINYIHGSLDNLENMIFGYGDEMDEDFKKLINKNDNVFLEHSKLENYALEDNYDKLKRFMNDDIFQVCIMGHSCGNSDRSLLNMIFKHHNCVSIRPFLYINQFGKDNYSDLSKNIRRIIADTEIYLDRIVKRPRCKVLDGVK